MFLGMQTLKRKLILPDPMKDFVVEEKKGSKRNKDSGEQTAPVVVIP